MRIVVTGATGFIGNRLVRRLLADGHSLHLLLRAPRQGLPGGVEPSIWNALEGDPPAEGLEGADAVIHLSGEPVAQRWTRAARDRIQRSRGQATRRLAEVLGRLKRPPRVLVSASAIGYYGFSADRELSEASPPGDSFLSEVCVDWERAAASAGELGIRVVMLRTGIALGAEGGALARMLPPFRIGAGGRLGSGAQWMSWIHVDDLVEMYRFVLDRGDVQGAWNGVAPNPVRNAEFTRSLASALHRPALIPVPAFALRMLLGEMAGVLLGSQRVLPRAAEAAGFRFRYPTLEDALRQLLP